MSVDIKELTQKNIIVHRNYLCEMQNMETGLTHSNTFSEKEEQEHRQHGKVGYKNRTRNSSKTMSHFEIMESCDGLSKPEEETGYTIRGPTAHDHVCKEHSLMPAKAKFTGDKKMKSKDIQSLVDRLSNISGVRCSNQPDIRPVKGVVTGNSWSRYGRKWTKSSKNSFDDLARKVYNVLSGKF